VIAALIGEDSIRTGMLRRHTGVSGIIARVISGGALQIGAEVCVDWHELFDEDERQTIISTLRAALSESASPTEGSRGREPVSGANKFLSCYRENELLQNNHYEIEDTHPFDHCCCC